MCGGSSLPWTRRDPATIADRASMSAALYRRRDGAVLGGAHPPLPAPAAHPITHSRAADIGGAVSVCEERLMHALDELPDPLKAVRDICRQ